MKKHAITGYVEKIKDPALAREYEDVVEKLIKKSPVPVHTEGRTLRSISRFLWDTTVPSMLTGNTEITMSSGTGSPFVYKKHVFGKAPLETHDPAVGPHRLHTSG